MKIFCGTDIIEIERIKRSIENVGEKFLETIYTKNEIEYCESHKNQKYQHYAARFAAKEAIFKALSSSVLIKDYWQEFEIINDANGRPQVFFRKEIPQLDNIDISISHCREYAVATVVAVFK